MTDDLEYTQWVRESSSFDQQVGQSRVIVAASTSVGVSLVCERVAASTSEGVGLDNEWE